MKNLLITGCNGQLGNEIQTLAPRYPQFNYYFTDIEQLDITNQNAINTYVNQNNIDCIINCAAYTAVDKAETNQELCNKLNNTATQYLAQAITQRQGLLIQISTDYVFNGTAHTPYTEDTPTCPESTYGKTKLSGEQAALTTCPNTIIIRTSWLYSTFGNNFVKTMLKLGKEKQTLNVIFDQIGTPTYAADLATAILTILTTKPIPGIYHFSNEGAISWYDFTKAIHRIAGITTCNVQPIHTQQYPTPAKRPHYSVLDKTKIKQTYHINIPYWEESLQKCIKKLIQ